MIHAWNAEEEAARLMAQRAADPDGEITTERMGRGFDVAEARAGLERVRPQPGPTEDVIHRPGVLGLDD